jgi:predicted metal-dependent hydrolase
MGADERADFDATAGDWPPYAFIPGGPWPHPKSSPRGHSFGRRAAPVAAIVDDQWGRSAAYLRGFALFNAGYYWEAHEVWEALWHAHGRSGPVADVLKGLIKLAAAGVKVRERQPRGVTTHARRAGALFESARTVRGPRLLGLDLDELVEVARQIAETPPADPGPREARITQVFSFRIEPREEGTNKV